MFKFCTFNSTFDNLSNIIMTGNKINSYSFWKKVLKILTWKIIVIYVSFSLIVYNVIKDLVEPISLPNWTLSFIVVFFIACFPVVILFSVLIDTSRLGKKDNDSDPEAKEGELVNEKVERRFQIIDIFLLIAVIAFVIFFIIYKLA